MALNQTCARVVRGVTMSTANDRSYHEARALDELQRADEAADPAVASAHRELAALHKRRMMEAVDDLLLASIDPK